MNWHLVQQTGCVIKIIGKSLEGATQEYLLYKLILWPNLSYLPYSLLNKNMGFLSLMLNCTILKACSYFFQSESLSYQCLNSLFEGKHVSCPFVVLIFYLFYTPSPRLKTLHTSIVCKRLNASQYQTVKNISQWHTEPQKHER